MESLPPELWQLVCDSLDAETVFQVAMCSKTLYGKLLGDEYALARFYAHNGAIWCAQRKLWSATRYALARGETPSWAVVCRVFSCDGDGDWKALALTILEREDAVLQGKNTSIADVAVASGSLSLLERILTHPRVDVTAHDNLLFVKACEAGNVELVKMLLAHDGVTPSSHSCDGFILAASNGHVSIMKRCLRWRGDAHNDSQRCECGCIDFCTVGVDALIGAIKHRHIVSVRFLSTLVAEFGGAMYSYDFFINALMSTPEIFKVLLESPALYIKDRFFNSRPFSNRLEHMAAFLSVEKLFEKHFEKLLGHCALAYPPLTEHVRMILNHPHMDPSFNTGPLEDKLSTSNNEAFEEIYEMIKAFPFVPTRKRKRVVDSLSAELGAKRAKALKK